MRRLILWLWILCWLMGTTALFAQTASPAVTAEVFRVVNVRSGPGVTFPVIGQLQAGDVVTITGRSNAESDWLQIDFEGQTGWVAYFVVSVDLAEVTTLPIVESIINGDEVAQSAPQEGISGISESAVTATAFRRVNVRAAPSTTAEIIITLERGDVVAVVGRSNEDSDWLQVEVGSLTGWVAYFVVSVDGDLSTLPVLAVELPATPAATATQVTITVVTRVNANLRTAPALNAEIGATVPFGTELIANGRNEAGNWLRVSYDDTQLWILVSLLNVLNNGSVRALPVVQPP
ncbi:MAG: SH3 domain-containing protein [Chloroflexota bacterium]|nr:SH3 domain-containing protein [Chloroflexota bacterium]